MFINSARYVAVERYKELAKHASRFNENGLLRTLEREIELEIAPEFGVEPKECWNAVWNYIDNESI